MARHPARAAVRSAAARAIAPPRGRPSSRSNTRSSPGCTTSSASCSTTASARRHRAASSRRSARHRVLRQSRLGGRPGARADRPAGRAVVAGDARDRRDRRGIVGIGADVDPVVGMVEPRERVAQHRADHRRLVPGRNEHREAPPARLGAAGRRANRRAACRARAGRQKMTSTSRSSIPPIRKPTAANSVGSRAIASRTVDGAPSAQPQSPRFGCELCAMFGRLRQAPANTLDLVARRSD